MDDVGRTLEDQGVASFHQSFAHVLQALEHKARAGAALTWTGLAGRCSASWPPPP